MVVMLLWLLVLQRCMVLGVAEVLMRIAPQWQDSGTVVYLHLVVAVMEVAVCLAIPSPIFRMIASAVDCSVTCSRVRCTRAKH
uniref:Secreted protein n=1 Tax=Anopheles darlingi TaxID=43151 RepID=A0A2M4DBV7_ANODA